MYKKPLYQDDILVNEIIRERCPNQCPICGKFYKKVEIHIKRTHEKFVIAKRLSRRDGFIKNNYQLPPNKGRKEI